MGADRNLSPNTQQSHRDTIRGGVPVVTTAAGVQARRKPPSFNDLGHRLEARLRASCSTNNRAVLHRRSVESDHQIPVPARNLLISGGILVEYHLHQRGALGADRNLSPNTQQSHRDTIRGGVPVVTTAAGVQARRKPPSFNDLGHRLEARLRASCSTNNRAVLHRRSVESDHQIPVPARNLLISGGILVEYHLHQRGALATPTVLASPQSLLDQPTLLPGDFQLHEAGSGGLKEGSAIRRRRRWSSAENLRIVGHSLRPGASVSRAARHHEVMSSRDCV